MTPRTVKQRRLASVTRRTFLGKAGRGVGSLALASMLDPAALMAASDADGWGGVATPVLPAKAKRVIHLCMAGGPSHLETLDHKPDLAALDGEPMPASFTQGQPIAQLQGAELKCLAPQYAFQRHGESGQEISDAFPHIAGIADDICIVRSLQTEQINHDPAHTFMNTGTAIAGRPSMGSWWLYGLGSEAADLPGFVVLISSGGGQDQPIATRQWHSGFLPGEFQGVQLHSAGDPVHYVNSPQGVGVDRQRDVVDAVRRLDGMRGAAVDDPAVNARVRQYEMAFRMQTSVPDLVDMSDEPEHILELYGAEPGDGSFASNCLFARRLAERGVRFIQLYHRGWDHHGNIKKGIEDTSALVDQASAALVTDLKQRGMLDDTLIIWGGEFGRTPMAQGSGRDHHIRGFSMWMAGGGIKGGVTYGSTDELGYYAVENIVHVHDLHATMLHLFGVDHTKLTYRFQGRDFRLTDVHGHVVQPILA
ncbi:DUF1501 domain-containing protein [Candidatus Poribacteria bacterium]|jgi:hypothetical protein|nr:DUF1501 domain-containing protein [Candidatus Poribacteria bacterium]MBT5712051.1 DUF1501 domain-containing protein [Candidatus Poribacteria bacterium]MBT7099200.1 DUF1501 domain-containing protein [Candidatus Poribacteria bacterium]MBT7806740.1 DUF1501 domain-containing protein [Candidatus Poribacteria bacterium]